LIPLAAVCGLLGCGGASAPPPAAPSPAESAAESPAAPAASAAPSEEPAPAPGLPSACSDPAAAVCTPPSDFVDRICAKPHQDVALALFAKQTPFTRLYLRGKFDELAFDEEVLALRFRPAPKNGIIVGGANGTYDVLRWDGGCSNGVDADMITRTRPPRPKTAAIKWHRIGAGMQDALIAGSEAVKRARAKRGKECKGAMTGDVSAECQKADVQLGEAIVDYVRTTGTLPEPSLP
jgi:hypothetical protein